MNKLKSFLKYFIIIIIIALIGGFIYWQQNKKAIIKDSIQNTVSVKTDNLYYVRYDSSDIDAINGKAVFYNIVLQSDSLQKEILNRSGNLPDVMFNIHVNEVGAIGVNVAGLLTNETISAKTIYLTKPLLRIINTGSDKLKSFTAADTLALYRQMIGKFNSIKADTIKIIDGDILITDKAGNMLASIKKINIELNNFLVDSNHNYSNIVSYFIKDTKATVENVKFPGNNNSWITLYNLEYDATKKIINIDRAQQYDSTNNKISIDLKKIQVNDLNTDSFILRHQLKAGAVNCNGGLLTVEIKAKKSLTKGDPLIELSDKFFDEAQVGSINLDKTKVIIVNVQKPKESLLELDNVKFSMLKKINIHNETSLSNIINNAKWKLLSDGFSFKTEDKVYKISIIKLELLNSTVSYLKINKIQVKPLLSETQFALQNGVQKDLYNFDFNNIELANINIKSLIGENKIEVENVSLQPILKIFNDRTLPPNLNSRLGTYPHQAILKIKTPFFIKRINVNNGAVFYKEKSSSTTLTGTIFFDKINAVITNITNIPEKIKNDTLCKLNATALLLDKVNFTTQWDLPLNTTDGSFYISGNLDSMDAIVLNPVIEPLALMAINKECQMKNLTFDISGNDYRTITNLELLYQKLNIDVLKRAKNTDELKKKEISSFFTNIVIKNDNPQNNETREIKDMFFKRDIHYPFFQLVWASIFTAAKKTVFGKNDN